MLEHEQACFAARLDRAPKSLSTHNFAEGALNPARLDRADVVMVGGSGDFSLVDENFEFHDAFLESIETLIDRQIPTFASCFGFQALVKVMGGTLERDPDRAELGTYTVQLTRQGQTDELFGDLPAQFYAQLGHKDSAVELPNPLVNLAESDRCSVQATRHPTAPIVATQFHPELSEDDNMERFFRYIDRYTEPGETVGEAKQRVQQLHAPSPESNRLLRRFIDHVQPGSTDTNTS